MLAKKKTKLRFRYLILMTTAQLRSASGYPRTEITEGISANWIKRSEKKKKKTEQSLFLDRLIIQVARTKTR